jgi:DNA-binding NarL/FixJ family response regulator
MPSGIPVICLETQPDVWAFALRWIGPNSEGGNLHLSPPVLSEIAQEARRLGPAILLSKLAFLNTLPRLSIRNLWAGKLQVIVVLGSSKEDDLTIPLVREGCSGILHLDDSGELWQRAIPIVASGQMWIPRSVLTRLLRDMIQLEGDQVGKITRRESEILELIGLGYDNRHIANELFISKETVRWHVRSLYAKIGASDRESAIRFWRSMRRGSLPSGEGNLVASAAGGKG